MIETDRLIAAAPASPQEEAVDRTLRPKALEEYIGQEKIRGQLSVFIEAARRRKEACLRKRRFVGNIFVGLPPRRRSTAG